VTNNAHIILYKRLLYLIAEHSGNMVQQLIFYTEFMQEKYGLQWSPYADENDYDL
jgi:hypothetical protein